MLPCQGVGKGSTRQRTEHVQRPWGRTVPDVFDKQMGDPCGWSRVSKGERGRTEGQGGDGEGLAGSCGLQEDLGFYPEGDGSPEVL